jgi:hypothetical protein
LTVLGLLRSPGRPIPKRGQGRYERICVPDVTHPGSALLQDVPVWLFGNRCSIQQLRLDRVKHVAVREAYDAMDSPAFPGRNRSCDRFAAERHGGRRWRRW